MTETEDSLTRTLAARLRERIKRNGPITFHEWMQTALYDERAGYYLRSRTRQGRAGDYRTAPEISPLFGRVFARYFVKEYFDLGEPGEFTIIEVGAGAGAFAHAVLQTLQTEFPRIFEVTHYFIDEISGAARSQAADKLADFKERIQFRSLAAIDQPLPHGIIFSNELLDAFPVNRLIGRNGKLLELYVGLNADDDFAWIEGDLSFAMAVYSARSRLHLDEGQIYEANPSAESFIRTAAEKLRRGLIVTVDYGATTSELLHNRPQGTLRAFHKHRFVDDVLAHPGAHDLTTTVDWTPIEDAGSACGLETLRRQRLDQFLIAEGALDLLTVTANEISDPVELFNFNAHARELILPNGMAASFQVLVQSKKNRIGDR